MPLHRFCCHECLQSTYLFADSALCGFCGGSTYRYETPGCYYVIDLMEDGDVGPTDLPPRREPPEGSK